ncbi:MAG: TldD/PmbA family protein [Clostridia bacterium]|nr:TldD/PmbA family protein [Clostridia bacterium]
MKQVVLCPWIAETKATAKALLNELLAHFSYASILLTDSKAKNYSISRSGISVNENAEFGDRGAVIRIYDGNGYAEYATNTLSEARIPEILQTLKERLQPLAGKLPEGLFEEKMAELPDESITFARATDYEVHPCDLGDEAILTKLSQAREKALSYDERILDTVVFSTYQEYHKLFLSKNKDLTQSVLWMSAGAAVLASRGEEIKESYRSFSGLGGAEVLDRMEGEIENVANATLALLDAEPIEPGTYDCICSPETTGMIVHEAFGHGVEMDMFVKDRALAKSYVGKPVASPLVTMHDGACAAREVATFFFDDEGTLAKDTVVIEKGILKQGICDAQSALSLGCAPTGNGRRESYARKAYTRMTNTFFEGGTDTLEDMIASIQYGFLLEEPSSGMEDPKNWGIQCMVNVAKEIKDGKLTGRIFSPIVLTGYVPDLLKSISMMTPTVELGGGGACGKGYKEWVKVSDGGPYMKAKIRLG